MHSAVASTVALVFLLKFQGLHFREICADRKIFEHMFTTDVQNPNFLLVRQATRMACSLACLQLDTCQSFGWQAASDSCWLYDHLAVFRLTGPPAPATAYFWALAPRCPTDRNYTLEAGVCFKVFPDRRNWTEAASVCSEDGGHLFVGDTPGKLQLLSGTGMYLKLGATDDEIEGQWWWVDGSRLPSDSPLWARSQPDGGTRSNYLGLKPNLRLDDGDDTSANMFPCQIPLA